MIPGERTALPVLYRTLDSADPTPQLYSLAFKRLPKSRHCRLDFPWDFPLSLTPSFVRRFLLCQRFSCASLTSTALFSYDEKDCISAKNGPFHNKFGPSLKCILASLSTYMGTIVFPRHRRCDVSCPKSRRRSMRRYIDLCMTICIAWFSAWRFYLSDFICGSVRSHMNCRVPQHSIAKLCDTIGVQLYILQLWYFRLNNHIQ
jgi:hypothetical protein